jgi:hypothetical protein
MAPISRRYGLVPFSRPEYYTGMDRPPRWLLAVGAVAAVLLVWLFLRMYTSPAVVECVERYRQAHTAAEIAAVDSLVPESHGASGRGTTCGLMKSSARWQ